MPKIIENLRPRLMAEADRQVREEGYGAMTVRSVASACGVGVGTVYNYFPSKDALVAACMLEDWNQHVDAIRACAAEAKDPESVVRRIGAELRSYAAAHEALFRDAGAVSSFSGAFRRYHGMLRSQLAEPLRPFCESDLAAAFIAEALLTWTMAGTEPEELCSLILKLF